MKIEHTRKWFNANRTKLFTIKGITECQNCSEEGTHLHHIVPLAVGGTNNIGNLALLCDVCHGKIHGKTFATQLQREGIARAKANGLYKGKPTKYTACSPKVKHAIDLYLQGTTVKEISSITGISKRTLYRRLKEQNISRA